MIRKKKTKTTKKAKEAPQEAVFIEEPVGEAIEEPADEEAMAELYDAIMEGITEEEIAEAEAEASDLDYYPAEEKTRLSTGGREEVYTWALEQTGLRPEQVLSWKEYDEEVVFSIDTGRKVIIRKE